MPPNWLQDYFAPHKVPYTGDHIVRFLAVLFNGYTHARTHFTLLPDTHTANFFSPLQESPEPLEVERSTGLFDSESELFRNNLMILTVLLCCAFLGGILWEVMHRLRHKMKIQPQGMSIILISQQLYNSIFLLCSVAMNLFLSNAHNLSCCWMCFMNLTMENKHNVLK